MNEAELATLAALMKPQFEHLEEKIDTHIRHMDTEHSENHDRFAELYVSRNNHAERLTKIETGVMIIKWLLGLLTAGGAFVVIKFSIGG